MVRTRLLYVLLASGTVVLAAVAYAQSTGTGASGPTADSCAVWRSDKAGRIRVTRQVLDRPEGPAALAS